MRNRVRWVYLTTAPNQLTAEMWQELLLNDEIPARIRAGDTASFLGISNAPCRLLVPGEHLMEAQRLLKEHLGPEVLT